MPTDLPLLDQYVTPLPLPARKKVAGTTAPPRKYDSLSPDEQAAVDRQIDLQIAQEDLASKPRGAVGEVVTGLKRGAMVELPRLVGQALKATGNPGNLWYDRGKKIVDSAEAREPQYARDTLSGAHGGVVDALTSGAEMVAPSLAPLAALPALLYAGVPTGAAALVAGAGGGALFGAGQFQDTYEKAVKAGKTPEEARSLGLQTGAIEGIGETAGGAVLGRLFSGARALPRILGRKYGADEALASIRNPKFLKQFAKEMGETAAVETGTEMGQNAGEAAVEHNAGIDETTPWQAATSAIGPTLALTGILGPLGALGVRSAQRRNRQLLNVVESDETKFDATARASRELAPQLEPLMGKEAVNQWRQDVLVRANQIETGKLLMGRDQQERMMHEADVVGSNTRMTEHFRNEAYINESLADPPPVPPSQFGVNTSAPRYSSEEDAQNLWDTFASKAATLNNLAISRENDRTFDRAFAQLTAGEMPPGVPSYEDFATAVRNEMGGEPANAAAIPERALKQAYVQHLNAELSKQAAPSGITAAEAAQPQLDLTHANADTAQMVAERTATPVVPREAAPGPNAMQAALLRVRKNLEFGKAERQREEAAAPQRAVDEERLAALATTTRRVEAANKQADDALAGKINGNTPIAFDGIQKAWLSAAKAAGIDTSVLRGANLARVNDILRKSANNKLWAGQIASLRKARDAAKPDTVTRDTLDALITHLESFNGQSTPAVQAQGQRAAAPAAAVRKENGQQSSTDGQQSSAGGQVSPAAVPQAEGQVVTAAAPDASAPPATPPAPAKAPVAAAPTQPVQATAPAPKQAKRPKTRQKVVVTSTGAEQRIPEGQPVPWGDFERNADGTINYATAPAGEKAATEPAAKPKLSLAGRDKLVPAVSQRKAREDNRYAFELYHYNPKLGPQQGTNGAWLADYAQAQEDALGFKRGKRVMNPTVMNARAALTWLHEYEGLYDWKADERAARAEAIMAVNERARQSARAYQESIEENVRYAYTKKLLTKGDREPTNAQIQSYELTDAQEREVSRIAQDDPGMQYLLAVAPQLERIEAMTDALVAGDFTAALMAVKEQGPAWMQGIVDTLLSLNLATKVKFDPSVARSPQGAQKFGGYNHTTNTITAYLGGDTPHTLIHEGVHAATVGQILFAKHALTVPMNQRTAEMHAAIVALRDLQAFMAELKQLDTKNRYAFKSEEEFVAEVHANEELQQWMRSQGTGKSLFARFVDWVRDLLGMPLIEGGNSLTRALSLTEPFLTGSRFTSAQGLSYDHSATGAMSQANATGGALVQMAEKAAAKSAFLGTLGGKIRSGLLQAATTFHISQWIDKVPALKPLVAGLQKYTTADGIKRVLLQTKQLEFSTVLNDLKRALAKLPTKAMRDSMNQRLMGFAGDMSMYGVDLNKTFDENAKTVQDLDPSLKDYIDRRHAEYMRLGVEFRRPLETSIRVYRKNYIQHTAMVLRDTLSAYESVSPQVRGLIAALDIRDKSLESGTNPNPQFYHDPYSANLHRLIRKALVDARNISVGNDHMHADVAEIEKFYDAALGNPYMHLGRSGDHVLEFNVANVPGAWEAVQVLMPSYGKVMGPPTEKRHVFMRFENPAQMQELRAKIMALPSAIVPDSLRAGSIFESDLLSMQGVPRAIQRLRAGVDSAFEGKEKAEIRAYLKRAYLDMLPDSSAQKALVQRKDGGVPGYDADFMRNFAKRAAGMASMIANQYALPMYDEAFDSMKEEVNSMRAGDPAAQNQANEVLAEMGRRFSNSLSPVESPWIDKAKAFGFNYFLALSPAFWLTNLTQPYHLTLPYIGGRYGFAATAKEMARSTAKGGRLIRAALESGWSEGMKLGGVKGALLGILDLNLPLEKTGMTEGEIAFVRRLVESGQLDTTQGHELGRDAAGEARGLTTTLKALSTGSHYTEVLNRLTAGLTAFNLAARNSKEVNPAKRAELAIQYGIETVRSTQFDYSDQNTGRAFGRHGLAGKVTPLLSSFQNYAFQTIELLTRLTMDSIAPLPKNASPEQLSAAQDERRAARKGLAGVMTTTSMLAGTLGLPLTTAIAWAVDSLIGDDDDPMDVKSAYRLWLSDVFGKDVGEAIARGIPRAVLGFDTSGRTGLQDLLPGSRFLADRRELKDRLEGGALNLLGPAVSAGASAATGMGHVLDGQVMDGLIEFLPLALKGPLKAAKMDEEGYTTATGNRLPIDVTPWSQVVQAVGFTPSSKAEQSEANFAMRQRDGLLKQRKILLANKLYRAIESGEDASALREEVSAFNQQNPQYRIDVGAGLAARAKARATAALSEAGIATSPRYLPQLDRYNYANVR